jgi:hypothetical protein
MAEYFMRFNYFIDSFTVQLFTHALRVQIHHFYGKSYVYNPDNRFSTFLRLRQLSSPHLRGYVYPHSGGKRYKFSSFS